MGFELLKLFMRYQIDFRILQVKHMRMRLAERGEQYSRSEGCDTNTGTNKQNGLELQEIFTSTAKWTIDHDTREGAVHRGVSTCTDNFAAHGSLSFSAFVALLGEIAADGLGKGGSEITRNTDVAGNVILLRSAGQGERVPLEVRHLGAADEDVLTSTGSGLLFLDL